MRPSLAPAQHVEAHVRCDPVEPGAQRRAPLEAVVALPGADEGVLHRILGLERRAEHPVAVRGQLGAVGFEPDIELVRRGRTRDRRFLHGVILTGDPDGECVGDSGHIVDGANVAGFPSTDQTSRSTRSPSSGDAWTTGFGPWNPKRGRSATPSNARRSRRHEVLAAPQVTAVTITSKDPCRSSTSKLSRNASSASSHGRDLICQQQRPRHLARASSSPCARRRCASRRPPAAPARASDARRHDAAAASRPPRRSTSGSR